MVASNGQRVLVTGATGYIGAHVVSLLLQKGYHVRAAVRNQQKADLLASRFSDFKDQLEFVFIDLSKPESFNDKLEGLTGVFHVAAPLPGSLKSSVKDDFLVPAIEGNLGLLRAAAKTPSVKRVVITSSLAAIMNSSQDPHHVYSEKDWNPVTYEAAEAIKPTDPGADFSAYISAKKLSEKAAYDFIEKEKPHFDIVTLLPSFVFGPAEGVAEVQKDISSLAMIDRYITTNTEIETPLAYHHEVDVRDVALAQVLAFESPKASNQRYLITAEPFAWHEIVEVAHKDFKDKTKAPALKPTPLPQYLKFDNSKSKNDLGLTYRKKEETYHDSIANLLELKQKGKLLQ